MNEVGWLLEAILDFLASLLRYPVPLAALALVVAPLWNVGRTVGLPLLFWHEQPPARRMAGVAVTLHAAAVTFVVFLLELGRRTAAPPDLAAFFAGAGAVVGALLTPAAVLRGRRSARYAPRVWSDGPDDRPGLVAGVRAVDGAGTGPLRSVHFSPWPLLQGAFVAAAGVALAVAVAVWLRRGSVQPPGWLLTALLLGPDTREPWLHLLALAMIVWIGIASWLFRATATPAVAICLLLAGLTALDGFLAFRLGHPAPGLLLGLVALVAAGGNRYKLRLPGLAAWYARPVRYPPSAAEAARQAQPLLDFLSRGGAGNGDDGMRRPLVLLCASGGGIRAATWTAGILEALDELPGFRRALHMVTGASGGMVGATFWIARLYAERTGRVASSATNDLIARVAGDSLTPVARALAFTDVPLAFTPFTNGADRGEALERAWRAQAPEWLDVTFGGLREHEARGECPSLVFSPMLVEDGRRLIFSNLDLGPVARNEVRWVDEPARPEDASTSAIHLDALFPGALAGLPLRTAARLSAAFPYLSPAVVLPTTPRRRVVDAGYYDNYGVNLACGWLRECLRDDGRRRWFAAHVSRVLVVQVRDNVSELSMNRDRPAPPAPRKAGLPASLARYARRGFEGITSPVRGVLAARTSAMLFQNDADLETVTELYDRAFGDGFLTTTVFELKADVSLSWYLTDEELALVRGQLGSSGIRQKCRDVAAWLAR